MAGSSGVGLPTISSHRLSFHYPRRRKSIGNTLDFPPSPSSIDETIIENKQWRDSTPDLNRFILKGGKIRRVDSGEQEENMDSALKSRNMRSASARRKKILEREDSLRREDEAREKRRREIIFGYASDEEQDSESDDGNTYSPIEDKTVEEAEKRSDDTSLDAMSQRNREDSPSSTIRRLSAQILPLKINTKGVAILPAVNPKPVRTQAPSPPPKQDALNVRVLEEDLFNCLYPNRASIVDDESDPEFDANDQYTPIEIATPIVFKLPRRRPTLVSIETPTSSTPSATSPKEPTTEPQSVPKPQRSAPRRPPSMISVKSGFAACEATPFEIPPLPTPPYNAAGFNFNLPAAQSIPQDPQPSSQPEPEPVVSPTIQKRHSSLLSRSKSWRENHKFRRQQQQPREEPQNRPRTSSATKSPISTQSSPSIDDWEFEIPPGFPLPPTNIPTPMSFLTEDPSTRLGLNFQSSQSRPEILPTLPRTTYSEPQALPQQPMSPTHSTSSRDTPSPHPSTSTGSSSGGFSNLLTRKKSLNGLRNRSGSVGKALASRGAKLGRQVSESVKKANTPPLPQPIPGSVTRDFASEAARR